MIKKETTYKFGKDARLQLNRAMDDTVQINDGSTTLVLDLEDWSDLCLIALELSGNASQSSTKFHSTRKYAPNLSEETGVVGVSGNEPLISDAPPSRAKGIAKLSDPDNYRRPKMIDDEVAALLKARQ